LLDRGRERYTIFCAPCHGARGAGDGMVVRRGFPAPPSYAETRLQAADDAHFLDVITHGWGVMYPYADRLSPTDRQAVVAYIRVLQQHQPKEGVAR
jgi:mono/diheme cytochrome c family protein